MFLFKKSSTEFYFAEQAIEERRALTCEELLESFAWIEEQRRKGLSIFTYFTYEASKAFDGGHAVHESDEPLAYFAVVDDLKLISRQELLQGLSASTNELKIEPEIDELRYTEDLKKVHQFIHDGDVYQINYSFRNEVKLAESGLDLFKRLESEHPVPYSCYFDCGENQLLSMSPELFLASEGRDIVTEPMKGTCPRAMTFQDDLQVQQDLHNDTKTRAENVMIVDLMRNDIGRICEVGSVKVEDLFEVTAYPSLHQMTSQVVGRLQKGVGLREIFEACYPPGSITGAPKIRAMEVIKELESSPRGVYTGVAGLIQPESFVFNVCIRTMMLRDGVARLGLGSGVVADSAYDLEWDECLLKGKYLNFKQDFTELFETILWKCGEGFVYLDEHLERLSASAKYFGISLCQDSLQGFIQSWAKELEGSGVELWRCRLALSKFGELSKAEVELKSQGWGKEQIKVKTSDKMVNSKSVYQYHKTDHRRLYNDEFKLALSEGYDEVLFFNEQGHLAEGAISNVFVKLNGQWLTPQLDCGLLPGVWRAKMISQLGAKEALISRADFSEAEEVLVGNSVRMGAKAKS